MRVLLIGLLLCCALAGCASHGARCEGPLQPINPAHAAREADAAPAATPPKAVP